jgi:hypothetical protein
VRKGENCLTWGGGGPKTKFWHRITRKWISKIFERSDHLMLNDLNINLKSRSQVLSTDGGTSYLHT